VRRTALILLVLLATGAWALTGAVARGSGPVPVPDFAIPGTTDVFLSDCSDLLDPAKRNSCYVRGLLAAVEVSADPANELPRIDRSVAANGGFLRSSCHILMHEVGRTWARRHGVTLETLNRYVPKSNDPGCSGGFGMGLVMHLGTELVLEPRKVLPICRRLPTRFRQYTCVHGSGHAFMRGYHGKLESAVKACITLGARGAPDCAQGAFHDFWVSLSGADGTTRPRRTDTNPRSVCRRFVYARPCWYRFFWERSPSARVESRGDLQRLCGGLPRLQREGCVGGASLLVVRRLDALDHAQFCTSLRAGDVLSCLRGVNSPSLDGRPSEQLYLVQTCARLPLSLRHDCYSWFGRTLAVVTNGDFELSGCPQLTKPKARAACSAGARRLHEPLATFS